MTPSALFPLTPEGYQTAVKWLKENDLLDQLQNEQSVDGYVTAVLANTLKTRMTTTDMP